jgi:hypothetical protein
MAALDSHIAETAPAIANKSAAKDSAKYKPELVKDDDEAVEDLNDDGVAEAMSDDDEGEDEVVEEVDITAGPESIAGTDDGDGDGDEEPTPSSPAPAAPERRDGGFAFWFGFGFGFGEDRFERLQYGRRVRDGSELPDRFEGGGRPVGDARGYGRVRRECCLGCVVGVLYEYACNER